MGLRSDFFDDEKFDFSFSHVVFVEGRDDAMFLEEFFKILGATSDKVRINVCGGKPRLAEALNLLVKDGAFKSEIRSIAVIFDSDSNPAATEREINAALRKVSLSVPTFGSMVAQKGKRIGVYTFPEPGVAGDLEEIAWPLAGPPMGPLSDGFIAAALKLDSSLGKLSKRRIQSYLAVASGGIRYSVGWAFRDQLLTIDPSRFPKLTTFLNEFLDS